MRYIDQCLYLTIYYMGEGLNLPGSNIGSVTLTFYFLVQATVVLMSGRKAVGPRLGGGEG